MVSQASELVAVFVVVTLVVFMVNQHTHVELPTQLFPSAKPAGGRRPVKVAVHELRRANAQDHVHARAALELGPPPGYLVFGGIGGIGNQRECIVSAVLLARRLGLGIILPKVTPLAWPFQEHGDRGRDDYHAPFDKRSEWGQFDLVFNRSVFVARCRDLGVAVVERELANVTAGERVRNIRLPPFSDIVLSEDSLSLSGLDTTTTPPQLGGGKNEAVSVSTAIAIATPAPTPHLYSVGSTCFQFAITRGENDKCKELGPMGACHVATSALVLSSPILSVVSKAVQLIRSLGSPGTVWLTAHTNVYWCNPERKTKPTGRPSVPRFQKNILDVIRNHVVAVMKLPLDHVGVFFATQLEGDGFKTAASTTFKYTAWKDDVLPTVQRDYPFEICAQIDFETGFELTRVTNGAYFGEFGESSSDDHLMPRLNASGVTTVTLQKKGACDCNPPLRC